MCNKCSQQSCSSCSKTVKKCKPKYIKARPCCEPVESCCGLKISSWKITNIVANVAGQQANVDDKLVNPWGIILNNSQIWVANAGSDTITTYDFEGKKLKNPISIRDNAHNSSYPTGLMFANSGVFPVSQNGITKNAEIMSVSEHGTLNAYNSLLNPTKSLTVLNRQSNNTHVFKGMTIVGNKLYAANFFQKKIDVFTYNTTTLVYDLVDVGTFVDPTIPSDYGPNNIVFINNIYYVLWAKILSTNPLQDLDGLGFGYISMFDTNGTFIGRFHSNGVLNSPWAMIPSPPNECGIPECSFLVGNNGDGIINVFDMYGNHVGPLLNSNGSMLVINGLKGLAGLYAYDNRIYFTSSSDEDADGLLGYITCDRLISL